MKDGKVRLYFVGHIDAPMLDAAQAILRANTPSAAWWESGATLDDARSEYESAQEGNEDA